MVESTTFALLRRCVRANWGVEAFAMRIPLTITLLIAGVSVPAVYSAVPTESNNRAVVTRIASHLSLDGALDEPDWANAPAIGDILQREPNPGEKATERTEVKLLYDSNNLYIGAMCYDSEPDKIIGTQMARDAELDADDRVEILIDTFRDRRNAFYFATNPAGALIDGLIIENGRMNDEWDAIWEVRTRRFEIGWSAEFAIPFKSLGFKRGQQPWGFNFSRTISRKIEEARWASPRLDVSFFQVSEAGEIEGFDDIQQGRGLDVRPYVSGRVVRDRVTGTEPDGKAGIDIFYNITPSLKWTTTFNTDFAETEVDNRQINLTRFPLFFPEKRAFFLENAGVFSFGPEGGFRGPELLPFFSRRIGLFAGREVPILAGTKLTGKAGRYDVGILGVRTRATEHVEAKNLFVARVKRNVFDQSYVGGIITEGNPASPASSRTFGVDFRLATSNFLGGERNFGVEGFYVKSSNRGLTDRDDAFGIGVSYPNDLWDIRIDWGQTGQNFKPALGFVSRPNVRRLSVSAEFDPRPKNFLNVRQMFHEFRFSRYTRLDLGRLESWRVFTAPVNYQLNSGDRYEFNWVPTFERLFEPFEIADGVVLAPGDYKFTRWRLEFESASKRPWEFEATWWFGSYWSGNADEIETFFGYKLAPHFQVGIGLEQTFGRLKEGNFVARILGFGADYSVSPYLTFYNLVQFDNESRDLGWQSRVRWIIRPGSELFLVFNQGWLQDERGGFNFRAGRTGLAGKLQYTFRF
jgi:hypothetical protein